MSWWSGHGWFTPRTYQQTTYDAPLRPPSKPAAPKPKPKSYTTTQIDADSFYEFFKESLRFLNVDWGNKKAMVISIHSSNEIKFSFDGDSTILKLHKIDAPVGLEPTTSR